MRDVGSLSCLVRPESLPAATEPVGVLENVSDVGRQLVKIVERDDDLSRLPVADLKLYEISRTLETLQFFGQSVELKRFCQVGVLAHDHRDELVIRVFFAR